MEPGGAGKHEGYGSVSESAAAVSLGNPILNTPYEAPGAHFEIGPSGPTGVVNEGRRPSESFIPVAPQKKGKKVAQESLDFDLTGERREINSLINDIRYQVDLWRVRKYQGVTPYSRKLLEYWADPNRENRVLYCQREAAETAIFLAEVAGRHGYPDFRTRLHDENAKYNDGLPRLGLKMATGSGKTVVMAMLIAWQTINKVFSPKDARFAKRFLIIAPGITIRDRLRVLHPGDDENYYRQRDLVPNDLWSALQQAEIAITNYHTFQLRDSKEFQGIAANTKKLLAGHANKTDQFKESNDQMVSRVLRDLSGRAKRGGRQGEIIVINDEAHHCYQDRPISDEIVLDAEDKKEAAERNADARVWFKGLQAIRKKKEVGIKSIYDLSATPFYLKGSGYNEGFIFPWVVSDFSLMDAIESGIVKIPRLPVDDNAVNADVIYRTLWDHVGKALPKKLKKTDDTANWVPPDTLIGALESLYRSYEKSFREWEQSHRDEAATPPVFIVVCPNTTVSKLVYEWIAGVEVTQPDETVRLRKGNLALFSNVNEHQQWIDKPNTVLIDSDQLESGEGMKDDFKAAAHLEIERFKDEYRRRNPGADTDKLTDEDLLREVMNTVGKPGRLGEGVRCVVSVSMLTEGWDANTVTHVLGVRRFGSQLLCEQVVGRGLRRRSYLVGDDGKFEPEYAEVYGVPFSFLPTDGQVAKPETPKNPAIEVRSLPERADLRIEFPKLVGYRMELHDAPLIVEFIPECKLHLDKTTVATWTQTGGIVGETDEQQIDVDDVRPQQVAFALAVEVLRKEGIVGAEEAEKPWLFPQLVAIAKQWLAECLTMEPGLSVGFLSVFAEARHLAAERICLAIAQQQTDPREELLPRFTPFDPTGSTDGVSFISRKVVVPATKSPLNYVVLDGVKGNSWEETLALLLEKHPSVASYVKNERLEFQIPYVHAGNSHMYVPDFLVRLVAEDGDVTRTLIVEVSGSRKSPGPTKTKRDTALYKWCKAVNNHGGFGRWGFIEINDMTRAESVLEGGIESLYADGPVTGGED